jgi:DNA-binding MarR family transcriptional regulator
MRTVDQSPTMPSDWTPGATSSTTLTASSLPVSHSASSESADPKLQEIRLALRIVVHLAQLGPMDYTARPEATQQGIASSLQVTQGAVSKVLRRLGAADVVQHERHHVWSRARRMQAYFLTPKGLDIARRFRERATDSQILD